MTARRSHVSRGRVAAFLAVLLLATTLAASGCGSDGGSATPSDVRSVTLGVSQESMSGLAYVARDKGLFASNGLDLEFVEYSSSQLAYEALLSGEVDAALCADTPIVLGALDNERVMIIATVATDMNDIQIVARADAGIATPKDLEGMRIGTREGTAAHFFLHSFLIKNGMTEDDVSVQFDAFESVTRSLIDGRLDAVSLREPFIAQLSEALGDDFVVFEEHGLYAKTMNLCVSAGDAAPDADVQRRLIRSLLDAEAAGVAQGVENTRIEIAEAIGISPEGLCVCIISEGAVGLDQSLLLTFEDQARWARTSGVARHDRDVDFLELINTSVLDEIAPERVTVVR